MKKLYFSVIAIFLFTAVNAQIINIPDANFKARLLAANIDNYIATNFANVRIKIDTNNDGEIQISEALQVKSLDLQLCSISNLIGIESFINLKGLNCLENQLTSLDVSNLIGLENLVCNRNILTSLNINGLVNLKLLMCAENQLSTLNVAGLTNLEYLNCYTNLLPELNLTNLPALSTLSCGHNLLTQLNLTGLTNLNSLSCDHNQLTTLNVNTVDLTILDCGSNLIAVLDVGNLVSLQYLYCEFNQIQTLDVSALTLLMLLECSGNQLGTLDVSMLSNLNSLYCGSNPLTSLNLKNGRLENSVNFPGIPNLQYICADESQLSQIEGLITQYGYANCAVNSYCSFTPGGTYYAIQGNNRYDSNNNGCDISDLSASNVKFSITDGANTGSLISNTTGTYFIPVSAGTQTLTPNLENPGYFNISPATISVVFPGATNPFVQDFCIAANGIHPDLEVSILPILRARPGFDAIYKLIYRNKGTNTQSGTVNFTFDDPVLDLVAANPSASAQSSNNLTWNFNQLMPFETREITVKLNVNSPVETPPVSAGYVLNYTAAINSAATEETPIDNTFLYSQTVANSLDPNDKTCIEGTTITPEMVGKEVHYIIRFENTGTANAENIVVKDMIDTSKFDINSLIPIDGSAPFTTRITGDKVEFIFQNINLPFDDTNNDGYVAFKIKTKPTLVLGNTFSNTASIYFDYNAPIATNTATTTVALLAKSDFAFENYFQIYPNPANDVLNIEVKKQIEVTSISIYNTLGQLILVLPGAKEIKTVDISALKAGNYYIKINSDQGSSNAKFIKL